MSVKKASTIAGLLAVSFTLISPLTAETPPKVQLLQFKMPSIGVETFSGQAVEPLLPDMFESVKKNFKGYPYLYSPPADQDIGPGDRIFVNDPDSLVVTIKAGGKWIGMAAGIPLSSTYLNNDYFSEDMAEKVRSKGFDPDKMFYIAYFLVPTTLRHNQKLISDVYDTLAAHAKSLGKTQLCSMEEVAKEEKLPLKPSYYIPAEPWDLLPPFTSMDVTNETSWPTIQLDGSVQMEKHSLLFMMRDL